jgi:hypothetical protein
MRRAVLLATLSLAVLATASPASGPDLPAWRSDLKTLQRELPARHPAPFLNVTPAQWDSACAALDRALPRMSRNERLVGFMRLVAFIGDAHTALEPDGSLDLHFYPVELYSFDDGLFVRRADPAHAGLAGAKVVRVGAFTPQQAMDRAATIVPHENPWWVRAWAPLMLGIAEFDDGLGISTDASHLDLVLERDGRRDTVTLAPTGRLVEQHGAGPMPIDMSAWASMRTAAPPLWEQRPDEVFWWTFDESSRTLYACMRAVAPSPHAFSNRPTWNALFAAADSLRPDRLVIDLRENTGGNGALNRYPVQQLLRRPDLDRPDRLFVITGRRTFSAAQQFANLLEAWTQATFVGEPTGQKPSQYGDHRPLRLPLTGLTVQVSTLFHQAPNETDARAFIPPRLYTPLDSRSYRDGVDPAMVAILSPDSTSSWTEAVASRVAAGDSAGAERALLGARDRVVNRFRSFEGEVNALGYRLLGEGHTQQALQVFRLNTRAYPHSANTFDSLAETLLAAGERKAAVATYRHALEVNPGFVPSQQALERLGEPVHPR